MEHPNRPAHTPAKGGSSSWARHRFTAEGRAQVGIKVSAAMLMKLSPNSPSRSSDREEASTSTAASEQEAWDAILQIRQRQGTANAAEHGDPGVGSQLWAWFELPYRFHERGNLCDGKQEQQTSSSTQPDSYLLACGSSRSLARVLDVQPSLQARVEGLPDLHQIP